MSTFAVAYLSMCFFVLFVLFTEFYNYNVKIQVSDINVVTFDNGDAEIFYRLKAIIYNKFIWCIFVLALTVPFVILSILKWYIESAEKNDEKNDLKKSLLEKV